MQRPPGFKSESQRNNFFEAATLHRRGGLLSPSCGARSKTGQTCTQVPVMGSVRCLRHAGPDAARAHRQNQLAGLQTGRVSPAEFARAEARRARNRLTDGWKRNPSLPEQTIDLGPNEDRFRAALGALGVDPGRALPAVLDWLRWRFQRLQVDRPNETAWLKVVQTDLRLRTAEAERQMIWVRAGNLDRRTKAGRALKAAMRSGVGHTAPDGSDVWPQAASGALGAPVRPWVARPARDSAKRRLPDRYKVKAVRAPKRPGPGRPRKAVDDEDEIRGLLNYARTCGPEVRAMMGRCPTEGAALDLLRTLREFHQNPNGPVARNRWMGLVMALPRA